MGGLWLDWHELGTRRRIICIMRHQSASRVQIVLLWDTTYHPL